MPRVAYVIMERVTHVIEVISVHAVLLDKQLAEKTLSQLEQTVKVRYWIEEAPLLEAKE